MAKKQTKKAKKQPELMTVKQAAELAGRSERLITKFCREGRFDCENLGKQWVIDREDFERFLRLDRPSGNPNFWE